MRTFPKALIAVFNSYTIRLEEPCTVKAFLLAVACVGCCSLSAQTPAPSAPSQACVKELPKPVRHVCGQIFTRQGERDGLWHPVRNAILTLMQDGKLVAREETHDHFSFDFTEKLTDGSYDLMVEAPNHSPKRFRIIVHKPIQKCSKGMLQLIMPLGAECGEIYYKPYRYVDFDSPVWMRELAVRLASVVH